MSNFDMKLKNGAYKNRFEYPNRVVLAPILAKPAIRLTEDELEILPEIQRRHASMIKAHAMILAEYNEEENRLLREFKSDLEAHYGITGHPKSSMLYAKAWEKGHSAGLAEVVAVYADLIELVK